MEFLKELREEVEDFAEDLWEGLLGKEGKPGKMRQIVIDGTVKNVRPAYIFAERIDNLIRLLFGVSIFISGLTASFLGFETLGGLLQLLIDTLWGRVIMLVIGFSYFIIALWKLLRLK